MTFMLGEYVEHTAWLAGVIIALIGGWYSFVTVPQQNRLKDQQAKDDKSADAQAARDAAQDMRQTARDAEAAELQKDMLKAQHESNLLAVKQAESTKHQNELRVLEIKRMNELVAQLDARIDKSFKALDGRLFIVERQVFPDDK